MRGATAEILYEKSGHVLWYRTLQPGIRSAEAGLRLKPELFSTGSTPGRKPDGPESDGTAR